MVVQAMAVGICSRNVYWKLFTSCGPGVGTRRSQELDPPIETYLPARPIPPQISSTSWEPKQLPTVGVSD